MREEILLNPEVYLKELNKKLQFLYRDALQYGNVEIEKDIKNLLKKTIISEILNEKYTIAISGLQGVGKTTLLKCFYDIKKDILPEISGIGEKIPVMISEWNRESYGYRAKIVEKVKEERTGNELLALNEVEIDSGEKFKEIAMEPGTEYIYLELMVPNKYFKTESKSFVLLPGVNQSNDEWNELTKHVLYNSSNCILVFNEQGLNNNNNTTLVNNIKKEFNDCRPVIALTFGDQSSDCNIALQGEVMERFQIPNEEKDRVIRTSLDKNEIERWKDELINALEKYSSLQKKSRLKQLQILNGLLGEDLEEILIKLESIDLENDLTTNNGAQQTIRKIMKIVNKSKNEIKIEYEKSLNKALDDIAYKAAYDFTTHIIDKSFFKKMKGVFFDESLKDKRRFEEDVINAWNGSENNVLQSLPERLIVKTMEKQYPRIFKLPEYRELLLSEGEREAAVTSITEVKESRGDIVIRKKLGEAIENITALFSTNGEMVISNNVIDSVEYLPLLALNMMLISEADKDDFIKMVNYQERVLSEDMKVNSDILKNSTDTRSKILGGVAAVLGIDSVDGTGNIIQAIASAIGISLSAGATVAISAGLSAGIVGMNLVGKVNKMDIQTDNYGKMMIYAIKEDRFIVMNENFNELIDKTFDKIEKQLQKGYRIDESESRSIRCHKNITDLRAFKNEVRENIYGHICYLEQFA